MVPRKLSKRIYLIITLFISIQFIYFNLSDIKNTKEILKKDVVNDLTQIVILLEQKLPAAYNELLAKDYDSLLDSEQIEVLNRSLQPTVDRISKDWPGYGMGYYSINQKIVALIPFRKDLLGRTASPEALKVYERKKLVITEIQDGFTWGTGTTIVSANYPLFHNGELIGHVWANVKMQNINSSIIKAITEKSLEYLLIWAALILIIGRAMKKFDKTITELISQITNDNIDLSKFSKIPELLPILQTVEMYKKKLRVEFEEREKVKEEIFRLDRLNMVGEMAAGIGHEIRNPMTTVRGFLQLMWIRYELTLPKTLPVLYEKYTENVVYFF